MEKIKLSLEKDSSVANIILDDGKGNVLDQIMMQEILMCFDQFKMNKHLKLITFQGQGKHFSFGASVSEHSKDLAEAMLQTFHKLFREIIELGVPTMAKISGQCLGGGMELAIMCNFLFADETAVFGQPEINLGVFPPPASLILPEKIGLSKAEELLLTGRNIDANEALRIGMIHHLFKDKEEMNKEANDWIERYIIPKSASSLRFGIKAARSKFNHDFSNFIQQLEDLYIRELMETKDANEGINAFLEKRKAVWSDH